jgi:hypothetical protein
MNRQSMTVMDNIKELLQKYFNGETSLAEEETLKCYFATPDVADELKQYIPLFACFAGMEAETLSDERFEENFRKQIMPAIHKHHGLLYHISIWSSAAAACVVLALGSIYYVERQNNYMIVNGKRINDPEKALMIAAEKLNLVTGKFNNSVSHVQQIRRVGKQLSVMQLFAKHDNPTDSLNTNNAVKTNEN